MATRKSEVWLYYVTESADKKYECKTCGKRIVSSGNTTNLRNHLRTHKIFLNEHHDYKPDPEKIHIRVLEEYNPSSLPESESQQMEEHLVEENDTQTIYLQQPEIGEEIEIHNFNSISEVPSSRPPKLSLINPKVEQTPKKRVAKREQVTSGGHQIRIESDNHYSRFKTKQERDDFDSVGEIVAYRLRKLKKLNARKCESEILNVILSYEMEENENQ